MIISDKYRYVFIELPRTGSTAISRELREHYDGRAILYKHATYGEFLRIATPAQRSYFVFSGIRNPLDDAVSHYFKLRTDHEGLSNPKRRLFTRLAYVFRSRQREFIVSKDADFSQYFLRFYKWPYDNWSALAHAQMDFVLRFEDLQRGFADVLKAMGAEQKRPLPSKNQTAMRTKEFHEYYDGTAVARAQWVFAVFMEKWGYRFPASWEVTHAEPSTANRVVCRILNAFRLFYWRVLRPSIYKQFKRDRLKLRKVDRLQA